MMKSNIKQGLTLDAMRSKSLATRFGSALAGYWNHCCFAPIRVSDPEKLGRIATILPMEQRLLRQGLVTNKTVNRLIQTRDRNLLREFDRLFSGGGLKWEESYKNIIVNEGLDHVLDVVLSSGTQDTLWHVGLLLASPTPLATWTATEIGSNDFTAYDEANLVDFVDGGVTGQSCSNSGSPADFSINADSSSIGGAFLIGTNAKATPAGTVYAAGAFTGGNKAADNGDTLSVTVTFTSADDGA